MIDYRDNPFSTNEPSYIFQELMFIATCGSFPEQYEVLIKGNDDILYQVGYVRLRNGVLSCSYPTVGCSSIYEHKYSFPIGSFPNEPERTYYLNEIAIKIKQTLEGISYGYS